VCVSSVCIWNVRYMSVSECVVLSAWALASWEFADFVCLL